MRPQPPNGQQEDGDNAAAGPLLRHDCAATMGASGAPLPVREDDAWRVAGLTVTALAGRRGDYAMPAERIRRKLTK